MLTVSKEVLATPKLEKELYQSTILRNKTSLAATYLHGILHFDFKLSRTTFWDFISLFQSSAVVFLDVISLYCEVSMFIREPNEQPKVERNNNFDHCARMETKTPFRSLFQDFPEEGVPFIKVGVPTYYFSQFCPKTG